MEYVIYIVIGICGGTLSGLLGIGGGIVIIPLLLYFTGLDIKTTTAVSMVQIFFASLSGTIFNYIEKNIKIKYALYFGIFSMIFSFIGSFFTGHIPDITIKILYLATVIISLAMFIVRSFFIREKNMEQVSEKTDFKSENRKLLKVVPLGAVAGFLGGVLGIGGGFLYVPVLMFFLDLPLKTAIATSLAIILFNSIPGVIGKIISIDFNWITALIISLGSVGGSRLGTYIKSKARPIVIKVIFIVTLLTIIIRVIIDFMQ